MKGSLLLLASLSLVIKPGVLASSNSLSRNVLHFGLKDNWVGRPAAFLNTTPGILASIYEKRRFKGVTADSKTVFDLGRSTSEDGGLTWQEQDDFLNGAKLSLTNDMSITAGGVLKLSNATSDKYYAVAYGIRNTNRKAEAKIHTRFAGENFVVNITEKGYEADGITPSLFEMKEQVYVAYLGSDKDCTVQIVEAKDKAEVTKLVLPSYFTGCRSPQIVLLDDDAFALIISAKNNNYSAHHSSEMRAYYLVGGFASDRKLYLNSTAEALAFDAGRDANHFTFFKNFDGITTVGWNGNEGYGSNNMGGLTLLRKVSYDKDVRRFKQEPLIKVDASTPRKPWIINLEPSKPQGRSFSLDEGALLFEMDAKGVEKSDLTISLEQNPSSNQFAVVSGNEISKIEIFIQWLTVRSSPYYILAVVHFGTQVPYSVSSPMVNDVLDSGELKNINGKLKVIVDRSTIEFYGEDGYVVATESYRLKDEKPLSYINVTSSGALNLTASLNTVGVTVKEETEPQRDPKPRDDATPTQNYGTTPLSIDGTTPTPGTNLSAANSTGAAVPHKTSGQIVFSSVFQFSWFAL